MDRAVDLPMCHYELVPTESSSFNLFLLLFVAPLCLFGALCLFAVLWYRPADKKSWRGYWHPRLAKWIKADASLVFSLADLEAVRSRVRNFALNIQIQNGKEVDEIATDSHSLLLHYSAYFYHLFSTISSDTAPVLIERRIFDDLQDTYPVADILPVLRYLIRGEVAPYKVEVARFFGVPELISKDYLLYDDWFDQQSEASVYRLLYQKQHPLFRQDEGFMHEAWTVLKSAHGKPGTMPANKERLEDRRHYFEFATPAKGEAKTLVIPRCDDPLYYLARIPLDYEACVADLEGKVYWLPRTEAAWATNSCPLRHLEVNALQLMQQYKCDVFFPPLTVTNRDIWYLSFNEMLYQEALRFLSMHPKDRRVEIYVADTNRFVKLYRNWMHLFDAPRPVNNGEMVKMPDLWRAPPVPVK